MDESSTIRLGPLETLIGYHLRRASAVVHADFARQMAGTGLRQVPFGILSIIAANPGINQGAVGRALGVKRANMVGLIAELVDAGLIARVVVPEDRRALTFTLTGAGQDRLQEGLARIRRHEGALLSGLSAAERSTLIDLLARIEAAAD